MPEMGTGRMLAPGGSDESALGASRDAGSGTARRAGHRWKPGARRVAFALAVATAAAGCGGGEDGPAAEPTTLTDAPSPTTQGDSSLGAPLEDQTPPGGTNGMTFDEDGRLWVADLHGGQIIAVDPADGSILARFGEAEGVRTPDDLAFDADGRLWWTDNASGDIGRIDDPLKDGSTSTTITSLGPGANPITVADDGSVWVARTLVADQLYRLDPADPSTPILVKEAPGQLNGFAFGPDGRLYAPRFVDGKGVVSALDPTTGDATDITGGMQLAVSTKVAADGTLRVLTVGPATVWTVDPATGDRSELTVLPVDVADNQALDADGVLWVSSFDQPHVWRIGEDGEAVEVPIGTPAN